MMTISRSITVHRKLNYVREMDGIGVVGMAVRQRNHTSFITDTNSKEEQND